MRESLRDKAVGVIERCRDMTIATQREDGWPQATVVSFVHDGLTLYFGCGARSQKARNMLRDPRVSVAMTAPYESWSEIQGLSMAAIAARVDGAAEIAEIGRRMWERFPALADIEIGDPGDIAFFRATPTVLSVLDYGLGFGHADTVAVGDLDVASSHEATRHRWLVPRPE